MLKTSEIKQEMCGHCFMVYLSVTDISTSVLTGENCL